MSTRREQDDGYVTLNAQKSRLNVFPELSGISALGAYLSIETFLQNMERFPALPPKVFSPQ